jgi:hypothetical protein
MLGLLAAIIAAACVLASFRRLAFALAPTALDAGTLASALRGEGKETRAAALASTAAEVEGAEWERAVLEAVQGPPEERAAALNEQLRELDYTLARWVRVPRVCASIATSSGLLLAMVALRNGLNVALELPLDVRDAAIGAAITGALNVVALGVAASVFCIAIQVRARKAVKERTEAADKLIERLEALYEMRHSTR